MTDPFGMCIYPGHERPETAAKPATPPAVRTAAARSTPPESDPMDAGSTVDAQTISADHGSSSDATTVADRAAQHLGHPLTPWRRQVLDQLYADPTPAAPLERTERTPREIDLTWLSTDVVPAPAVRLRWRRLLDRLIRREH